MARGRLRIYLGAAPGVGQDRRHARRGPPTPSTAAPTSSSASSRPTAGPTRPDMAEASRSSPARAVDHRGADLDRAWTSTPSSPVDPRSPSSTSSPTPTLPGSRHDEAVAGHRRPARRRHRRHHHGQHPAPRVAQRRRRVDHRGRAARDGARTTSCARPTRSSWSTCRRRRCGAGWRTATSTAAEKVDAALANYFRPGNLSALRELALLWLADRVDEAPGALPRRRTASRAPGRPASGSSSPSPAGRRARPCCAGPPGSPPAAPAASCSPATSSRPDGSRRRRPGDRSPRNAS